MRMRKLDELRSSVKSIVDEVKVDIGEVEVVRNLIGYRKRNRCL